jgi:hypothetical protein
MTAQLSMSLKKGRRGNEEGGITHTIINPDIGNDLQCNINLIFSDRMRCCHIVHSSIERNCQSQQLRGLRLGRWDPGLESQGMDV